VRPTGASRSSAARRSVRSQETRASSRTTRGPFFHGAPVRTPPRPSPPRPSAATAANSRRRWDLASLLRLRRGLRAGLAVLRAGPRPCNTARRAWLGLGLLGGGAWRSHDRPLAQPGRSAGSPVPCSATRPACPARSRCSKRRPAGESEHRTARVRWSRRAKSQAPAMTSRESASEAGGAWWDGA